MHLPSRRCCAALVLGLFLAGCSGEPPAGEAGRSKVFKVKGKITMGGSPVADAFVSFSPKGTQPAATGRTAADGTYTLKTYDEGDGAAAGDYVVLVTKNAVAAPPPGGPVAKPGHDREKPMAPPTGAGHAGDAKPAGDSGGVPAKYARADLSDLTATVKEGGANDFPFELKP